MKWIEEFKKKLEAWKPIHLCWLFERIGWKVPRYLIGVTTTKVWIKRVDDDVNFSENVDWHSVRLEDNITSQVNTLRFNTRMYEGVTFTPQVGDEIELYDYNSKIFAGYIVKITKRLSGKKLLIYEVEVKDYTYDLDGKLVPDSFSDTLVENIIDSIVSNYLPAGYTTNNVTATGVTLEYVSFNYEYPSKCFQQLAELIGYDWYVDYNKDIHFFPKTTGETAPFSITDAGTNLWRNLVIVEDQRMIKNVIYVRGGEYVADSRTDKVGAGDGVTKIFDIPYRYDTEPTVTVNTVGQTVGIDYIDSEDDYDCLWNYQEKILRFKVAPATGDVVAEGTPLVPVLIKAQSGASVSVHGDREYRIVDKDIITKSAARQRAAGEITDYAETIREGSFMTYSSGLISGMKITVDSEDLKVNRDYIITRVVMRMLTPLEPYYEVIMTSARTMGIIDYLQKQINEIDKKIGPIRQAGEVLDVIMNLEDIDTVDFAELLFKINNPKTIVDLKTVDTITNTCTLLRAIIDSPPIWVCGPYSPINDADRKRPLFLDRDCQLRI